MQLYRLSEIPASQNSRELVWDAAKQRAKILVETLETRYNDVPRHERH
jgi:hypothetical protein